MLVIDSTWNPKPGAKLIREFAQFAGNTHLILSRLRPSRRLAAWGLTIAAHSWIVLVYIIGNEQIAPKPHAGVTENVTIVQLIKPDTEVSPPVPDPTEIETPRDDPLPAAAQVASKPPAVDISASYYFRTEELTDPPRVLRDVLANQPLRIPGTKSQKLILHLFVSDKGDVDQVLVQDSQLSEEATRILVEKFSKMKFEPGKIEELPVKSQMTIEIEATATRL